MGLGTLLLLDSRPARLPGWGVITAGMARELAAAHADAEWRVAVTDDSGALIAALVTRHRPAQITTTPREPRIEGAPRPVVEMHVSEAVLDRLRPGDHPGWARVLADLRHQLAQWRAARAENRAAREAELRAAGQPAAEHAQGRGDGLDDAGRARVAARRRAREALARFPSASLRRWTTMRDRSCVFPPCGTSALDAEIDHTRAVVDRGLTRSGNLGPTCSHDHDLKDQGWTLTQPRPGWFRWHSPTGHTYERPPRSALDDLPDAAPPAVRSSTEPHEYADDGPLWTNDPRPPPGTRPAPPSGTPPPGAPAIETTPPPGAPVDGMPGGPTSLPPDDLDPPPF